MKIIAIDFETANSKINSACSIGISEYENGTITSNQSFLILPPKNVRYFTNTFIHHITKEDVIGKKEFDEHYAYLKEKLEGNIILAHNARFDIGVLNAMCDSYGLKHIKFKFIDTVSLSRKVYPNLINHKLNTVANHLKIDLNHHDAGSDSFACLMIVIDAMNQINCFDLDTLLMKIGMGYSYNR